MGTIGKITDGSGVTHLLASTAYGTCPTPAATVAKVATIQEEQSFTLFTGVTIHIKFTYANTATSPTLNVNETGAKAIVRYGTTAAGKTANDSWSAGAVVSFTYDGTSWVMNGHITNTNSTYSVMSLTELNTGTATTARSMSAKNLNDGIHQNADIAWDATNKKLTQLDANTAVDKLQFVAGNNITLTAADGKLTIAGKAGTVTSVQVQATSPVVSSTSTAQTSTLNTTISLADGYGDTKNPYSAKDANLVLAGPASGNDAAPSFRALVIADLPSNIPNNKLANDSITIAGTEISLGGSMDKATLQGKIFHIGTSAPSDTDVIWLKPVS